MNTINAQSCNQCSYILINLLSILVLILLNILCVIFQNTFIYNKKRIYKLFFLQLREI